VLIVTEESFIELYGKQRMNMEAFGASLAMFRPVKTVSVANDAGDDIVPFAIADKSSEPFCVLFPLRFARSARLYKEQNMNIPVIILEGRYPESENPSHFALGTNFSGFFIYKTDINIDFYRAGLAASGIKPNQNSINTLINSGISPSEAETTKKIIVFTERSLPQARDNFMQALLSRGNMPEIHFYTNFSQFSGNLDQSCIVMAGSGSEFLDKKAGVPIVIFSWLDPLMMPPEAVLVINDSPWAQVRQAVKLFNAGELTGQIASKFVFLDKGKFERGVVALIKKTR